MRDYKLREELINNIVNLAYEYKLDGINIDFENMYEEDKELFSRFINSYNLNIFSKKAKIPCFSLYSFVKIFL